MAGLSRFQLGHLDFDFAERIAQRFVFGAGQVLCGLQQLIVHFRTDAERLVVANRAVQHPELISRYRSFMARPPPPGLSFC
jgi:hypothetical protein